MLPAILHRCPLFYRYAVACYGKPVTLFAHGFQLESADGEHQGDPLAPAFFAATIQGLVDLCNVPGSHWSLWYLDDGHLMGSRSALSSFLPILESHALSLGLSLNRSKCSVLFIDPPPTTLDLFPGVPIVRADQALRILGSPIGCPSACQAWVSDNILAPLQQALSRLECLGDPHSASLVLRQCLGGIKVNFLLRTADPLTSIWTASQVSPMLRVTWGILLGTPVSDAQWELACLPIRLGGAGIQDPVHFCDAAFVSSWLSAFSSHSILSPSQPPLGFSGMVSNLCLTAPHLATPLMSLSTLADWSKLRPHPLFSKWQDQSSWADESYLRRASLWDTQVEERLRSLRSLQTAPNAGLWLTALPAASADKRFSAPEWQALLRHRTGVPLSQGPSPVCSACGSPMDFFGDHSLCCASAGIYRRHNRIRDTLFSLSQDPGWQPILEPATATLSRPADVLLHSTDPKPLAVDVTIVHPLRLSGSQATRDVATATASDAESAKRKANSIPCRDANWLCCPFGVETTGGMGPSASKLCNRLARAISMKRGISIQDPTCRVQQAISVSLAKGRGEMLVAVKSVS